MTVDRGTGARPDAGTDAGTGSPLEGWAATSRGVPGPAGVTLSGPRDRLPGPGALVGVSRTDREATEDAWMSPVATRARGGGDRAAPEDPDPVRTCFERDRDRILHSRVFRRLADLNQVFRGVLPDIRTRLTHSLEVAQIAVAIAHRLRLNAALTEAVALGHDCGHGPGGHIAEVTLSAYLGRDIHHAAWGADVTLAGLNLCAQTLDGIRNHSWRCPPPATPEGEVVRWADRFAYLCHDLEDAVAAGLVDPDGIPAGWRDLGDDRRTRIGALIDATVTASLRVGWPAVESDVAELVAGMRRWCTDHIYRSPLVSDWSGRAAEVITHLVDWWARHPHRLGEAAAGIRPGSPEAAELAAAHVMGLTDQQAAAESALTGGPPWPAPVR